MCCSRGICWHHSKENLVNGVLVLVQDDGALALLAATSSISQTIGKQPVTDGSGGE